MSVFNSPPPILHSTVRRMGVSKSEERIRLKDRIVEKTSKAIKRIQESHLSSCSEVVELTNEQRQIQDLLKHLDHALLHGLRHVSRGYWAVVKEFTDTRAVKELLRLTNVTTNLGRGRSWLYLALNDGLMESYLRCFINNVKIVRKYYAREAIAMDQERLDMLATLVSGLDFVVFKLDMDVAYLDVSSQLLLNDEEDTESDRVSLCSVGSSMSQMPVDVQRDRSTLNFHVNGQAGEHNSYINHRARSVSMIESDQKYSSIQPEVRNNVEKSPGKFKPFIADLVNVGDSEMDQTDAMEEDFVIRVKSKGYKNKRNKKQVNKKQRPVLEYSVQAEQNVVSGTAEDMRTLISEIQKLSAPSENFLGEAEDQCAPLTTKNMSSVSSSEPLEPVAANQTESLEPVAANQTESVVLTHPSVGFDDETIEEVSNIEKAVWQNIVCQNKQHRKSLAEEIAEASMVVQKTIGASPDSTKCCEDTVTDIGEPGLVDASEQDCDIGAKAVDIRDLVVNADKPSSPVGTLSESTPKDLNRTQQSIEGTKYTDMPINKEPDDIYASVNNDHAVDDETNSYTETINLPNAEKDDKFVENVDCFTSSEGLTGEMKVDNNSLLHLMLEVFQNENEKYIKMFRTHTGHTEGDRQNVFVVLTDKAMYILSKGSWGSLYTKESIIKYTEVDYLSLSINYQVMQIVCTNRRKQSWLTTGSECVTRAITSSMDQAFLSTGSRLTVLTDATTQKIGLKKWAAKECNMQVSAVQLRVYSLVHWEDMDTSTTRGVSQEGVLHFRYKTTHKSTGSAWMAGYFVLKDGTLFQYADRHDNTVPKLSIQLYGEECAGCRRCLLPDQPHAFEIIHTNNACLQLAAASTSEANEWLLGLCQAVSEGQKAPQTSANGFPCCLVLVQSHVLLCHEDPQTNFFRTLGSACVTDITGITIDPGVDIYCVLEFESSDANISSNQWLLYFNANLEREKFLNPLADIWSEHFKIPIPIALINDVPLQNRCRSTAASLT